MENNTKNYFNSQDLLEQGLSRDQLLGECESLQEKKNKPGKHKEVFLQVSQSNEMAKRLVRRHGKEKAGSRFPFYCALESPNLLKT